MGAQTGGCVMGRRTATAERRIELDAAALRWRLSWLVRVHALHVPTFERVAAEAQRLDREGLCLAEQVRGLENFIAGLGLLDRAERIIASLPSNERTAA